MEDFHQWSYSKQLIHLLTVGILKWWQSYISSRQKSQYSKIKLKDWNKHNFGLVQVKVMQDGDKLKDIKSGIKFHGHSELLKDQEKRAQVNLDLALNLEEACWRNKSIIN